MIFYVGIEYTMLSSSAQRKIADPDHATTIVGASRRAQSYDWQAPTLAALLQHLFLEVIRQTPLRDMATPDHLPALIHGYAPDYFTQRMTQCLRHLKAKYQYLLGHVPETYLSILKNVGNPADDQRKFVFAKGEKLEIPVAITLRYNTPHRGPGAGPGGDGSQEGTWSFLLVFHVK